MATVSQSEEVLSLLSKVVGVATKTLSTILVNSKSLDNRNNECVGTGLAYDERWEPRLTMQKSDTIATKTSHYLLRYPQLDYHE